MQGSNNPDHDEEEGQLFLEGHALSPSPGLLIGIIHVALQDIHPFHLGPALHSVPVVALHLHLLDNALKHIPVLVPSAELVTGLLFPPDGKEIPHVPMAPVVRLELGIGGRWDWAFHGPWWFPWALSVHGWLTVWL